MLRAILNKVSNLSNSQFFLDFDHKKVAKTDGQTDRWKPVQKQYVAPPTGGGGFPLGVASRVILVAVTVLSGSF